MVAKTEWWFEIPL